MFGSVQPVQRSPTDYRVTGLGRLPALALVGLLLCSLTPLYAAENPVSESGDRLDYSTSTHHQLTELGARWDELTDSERRALLREVKLRMAQRKDAEGVLMIRTQRRYGRIYRHADGRVLRIETQVVQVRPVEPGDVHSGFGVGYERRSAEVPETGSPQGQDNAPPTILVNDPSRH